MNIRPQQTQVRPFHRHEPPSPPKDPGRSQPSDKLDPPVNQDRLVHDFLELVTVRGETRNERLIADKIKSELGEMGLEATEDDAGSKIRGNTGNLLVNIPGNVEGAPSLLFAAHMDTVPLAVGVKPVVEDGYIKSDGTTALGGDNRAGVAEILEAVREVKESNLPHGDLQLLFTVAEEGGLLGARAMDPTVLTADYGFAVDVFEANQLYTQGRHFLANGQEPIGEEHFTPEGVRAAKEAAKHAPVVPPEHLRLSDDEKKIMNLATDSMQDLGFEPEFKRIEWAGTDAIALRGHGMNAISLGAGEDSPHSRSERVEIADLVRSTQLIRSIISNAAELGGGGQES
jgi:di/tripeptidase